MRLRRTRSPLLLLLLPSLAVSLAVDSKAKPGSVAQLADGDAATAIAPARPVVGTKDAPVDGLDGKPHAGPFVEKSGKKKPPATVEDLGATSGSLSDNVKAKGDKKKFDEGWAVPEREDSVMDDRGNDGPRKGKTGTEGGVSEKDRLKLQEGKGKSSELKKPEQPKEAPPLPASVGEKTAKGKTEKSGKKEVDSEEKPKQKGAAGLEV
jgi:hypothetical protein